MTSTATDPRLEPMWWDSRRRAASPWRLRVLLASSALFTLWYFGWLLQPQRVGNPLLYGLLLVAETFNLVQAAGFWWTVRRDRARAATPRLPAWARGAVVDVLIPVYNEPLDVVAPTIIAATQIQDADVRVAVLDDGNNPELERLARRVGAQYFRRGVNVGAKAGNLNHALALTTAPFVVVLDCDHVPDPRLLTATLGHFADPAVAFVQTPQYYANGRRGALSGAAWAQQALFFGPIARGKDAAGAMFCCGTNVVFRRTALEQTGGFPEDSLTEDFELSVHLHELGWRSVYVPDVVARGLGPEDMAAYVGQQRRWARGCLSTIPRLLRAALPARVRAHYLLSAMYFLTGWTVLVYMSLPVIRILTGAQPLAGTSADQFLIHFAPYFGLALLAVAMASAGSYTFAAFALASANFWVHIGATVSVITGRRGRFVVTPKRGYRGRQPRAVAPGLAMIAVLLVAAAIGLLQDRSPATLNNVAFALVHVTVLSCGVAPALLGTRGAVRSSRRERKPERVAA